MEIEIPLQDPSKLLGPLLAMVQSVTDALVDDGTINVSQQQQAADGVVSVLSELTKFSLRMSDNGKPKALVVVKVVDDAAAMTMMRQAAIDAVKLQKSPDAS